MRESMKEVDAEQGDVKKRLMKSRKRGNRGETCRESERRENAEFGNRPGTSTTSRPADPATIRHDWQSHSEPF